MTFFFLLAKHFVWVKMENERVNFLTPDHEFSKYITEHLKAV